MFFNDYVRSVGRQRKMKYNPFHFRLPIILQYQKRPSIKFITKQNTNETVDNLAELLQHENVPKLPTGTVEELKRKQDTVARELPLKHGNSRTSCRLHSSIFLIT